MADLKVTSAASAFGPDAFSVTDVLKRESPDVLRYLSRRTENFEDAADLLGDALTTAWRKRNHMPQDALGARLWLFGVARRHLANYRRGKRRHHVLVDALRAEVAVGSRTTSGPEELVAIRALLGELTEADREIVTLVAWEGFSLEEAGVLLGLPGSTARSRYARAKERLRIAAVGT